MEETTSKSLISGIQLQEALQKQDWGVQLQAHAVHRLKRRYGIKGGKDALKERSQETVQSVLNLVFIEETRKWNADEYPSLEEFLYSAIDSHLYNSFVKKAREISGQKDEVFEKQSGNGDHAQQIISAAELRKQIVAELKELNADDDEILVFECMFDGLFKPADIRKELGISEEEFHNIWRKVGRKRDKLKNKLSSYGY